MHQVFRITLDDALPVLAAARAKAEELGVKQTLCVVDDGGHVVALHRLPGARPHRIHSRYGQRCIV